MAGRPGAGGLGRGGRGAALLQLINQPVRAPGDAPASGQQQPAGAFGRVQPSAAPGSSEPGPPGQVHVTQPAAEAATGPPSATRLPQGQTEAASQPLGRGAMLQKLYDSQTAQQQQQQPTSVSATPSAASLESG